MVSHRSSSDNKSPQVSRVLSIRADLNNAVVWMILTCSLVSKSSSPFINPLATVPRTSITIGITVNFMFHIFFQFPQKFRYLLFFSLSVNFALCSARAAKSTISFFFILMRFGCLTEIRWFVFTLKRVCVSHSPGQMLGCAYTICSYGQTPISCTILGGSLCQPSQA